jgi:hypothetical protein
MSSEVSDCNDDDDDDICDDEDDCVGSYDECGVCGGSGIPNGDCDCDGNILDCSGECGGSFEVNECGVCGGSDIECPTPQTPHSFTSNEPPHSPEQSNILPSQSQSPFGMPLPPHTPHSSYEPTQSSSSSQMSSSSSSSSHAVVLPHCMPSTSS